jgi:hypothetical protein
LQDQWIEDEEQKRDDAVRLAWLTANMTGAAAWGKLKKLNCYLPKRKREKQKGDEGKGCSVAAFDDLLARLEAKKGGGAIGT